MPFPRRLLHDGEDVALDLRPHWSSLARPALALVAGLALALGIQARVSSRESYKDLLLIPVLVLVVVLLLWFAARYARWASWNLAVTSERVVIRSGVVGRRGREVPLEQVRDVTVDRRLVGRLFGVGSLTVRSAVGDLETFPDCPRVSRVRAQILERADAADRVSRPFDTGEPSPLAQLEKLEELRGRGVISQAEFDAKKAQLLGRL